MKKTVFAIIIIACMVCSGFSKNEANHDFTQRFASLSMLATWFTSHKYQVRKVADYSNLPPGASYGAWFHLNKIEYNCYLFKNEEDFKKFNERYMAMTYGLMVQVLRFDQENAKKIVSMTEFKTIYNAKCATNPGNVPL